MKLDYVSIGNRIREIRRQKQFTQEKLAELSGIEPSNISHIERAATKASLPTLISIANVLGVSLDELVFGSLIKSEHVSVKMINDLISDCSPDELNFLYDIMKQAKESFRKFNTI